MHVRVARREHGSVRGPEREVNPDRRHHKIDREHCSNQNVIWQGGIRWALGQADREEQARGSQGSRPVRMERLDMDGVFAKQFPHRNKDNNQVIKVCCEYEIK